MRVKTPQQRSAWSVVWLGSAIMLLALGVLSGCAASPPQRGIATPATPTVGALTTTTDQATATPPAPTLTLAQAWGAPHITRLPTAQPNNELFAFEGAATPDGQWLVGEIEPRDLLDNHTIIPTIALYNVSTHAMRFVHALLHPQSQIETASTDGRWLVWSEATQQAPFEWRIFAYDMRTGATRQVAQAPRINGQPVSGPNGGPVVSDGHVIWSQPIAPVDASSLQNIALEVEDMSSGVVSTLAMGVGQIACSWPWIAWTQAGSNDYLSIANLETHAQQRLDHYAAAPTLSGASLTFGYYSDIDMIADVSQMGAVQTLYTPPAGSNAPPGPPSISARLVAWGSSGSPPIPLVWDRMEGTSVLLPASDTAPIVGAWTSGTLLVWTVGESQAQQRTDEQNHLAPLETLYIVDTSTLPTRPPGA